MKSSLQDFLPRIYSSLSIVDSSSLSKISNIGKMLPNFPVIAAAGFECHLAKEKSVTDFSFAFSKSSKFMIDEHFNSLPDLARDSYSWQKIDTLIKKWNNKESLVYEYIDNFWLEFDVDTETSDIPEPSIFFVLHPLNEIVTPINMISFAKYNWIVPEILSLLTNDSLSTETISYFSKCCDLLLPGSRISHVGVMLPRHSESKAIRLCIKGVAIEKIPEYLNSIGWTDTTGELASVLNEIVNFTDSAVIGISVENGIHPKIGIECYIDKQPNSIIKWQMFFDFLLEKRLCTKEEVSALLDWPGYITEESGGAAWPKLLSQSAMFTQSHFKSMIARSISHIKITYQPTKPLQAKAYLLFGHCWLDLGGRALAPE